MQNPISGKKTNNCLRPESEKDVISHNMAIGK